jgi:hypothetical protein
MCLIVGVAIKTQLFERTIAMYYSVVGRQKAGGSRRSVCAKYMRRNALRLLPPYLEHHEEKYKILEDFRQYRWGNKKAPEGAFSL